MKVKEFMITDVISASPDMTLAEVMALFVDKKVGGVPICGEDGELLGMVTDGDILRAIQPIDRQIFDFLLYMEYAEEKDVKSRLDDSADRTIISIAKKKNLVTVSPEDKMDKAVKLLSQHHFKKLPVIDKNNRVVGVISRGDVIRKIQATILKDLS
ncbi:CBS domain-containing protein [Neobacillus notoginsengisoli]|uniref:CBS domain-containing protein n=1 Tax=Neobacillus notoginsengisoli TaxID=1578198 RepID=A0A417YWW0_9BACI|nr:CBS domain-containing protein [Neobacillus notoginsengisoli]RHW42064.1 CBS domain-containing protein [Neobacillus notoginsengisoli]